LLWLLLIVVDLSTQLHVIVVRIGCLCVAVVRALPLAGRRWCCCAVAWPTHAAAAGWALLLALALAAARRRGGCV
jgi:hypothetical protein